MAVLSWIGAASVALVTGCYAPELRDCVVNCTSSADCAPEQVCGSDHMCASAELAGRCARPSDVRDGGIDSPIDARIGVVDAPPMVDAPPPIDAATDRWLRIEISGRGGVTVGGVGVCHHTAPSQICTFQIPAGMLASLEAMPDPEHRFDKWETGPCAGEDENATCAFLPVMFITDVKVKFRQGEN